MAANAEGDSPVPHSRSNALLWGEVQSLFAREPTALGKPGFAQEPLALLFLKGGGALFELFHPGARLLQAPSKLPRWGNVRLN